MAVSDVLSGQSDKIVVIVGPCSIHNPAEAKEYAALLLEAAKSLPNLVVIMRAYFEKVRSFHFDDNRASTDLSRNSPERLSDGRD